VVTWSQVSYLSLQLFYISAHTKQVAAAILGYMAVMAPLKLIYPNGNKYLAN